MLLALAMLIPTQSVTVKAAASTSWYIIQNSDGQFGLIDEDGNVTIETKYNYMYALSESDGLFVVENSNGKSGIINKKGKVILEPAYDSIYVYNEGDDIFILRSSDDKYGGVYKNGKVLEEPIYDYAYTYNGFLIVENYSDSDDGTRTIENKLINKKGKVIYEWTDVVELSDGC